VARSWCVGNQVCRSEARGDYPSVREYSVRVPSPSASVVIPVHNEERHIRQLLESLQTASRSRPLSIVVVCNGCTDASEQIARTFDGVTVLVSDVPAKYAALNAGDEAANDVFPRLYVDGDIRIDPSSVCELLGALDDPGPMAVGPETRYDLTKSPWIVRAFFRTSERLPFNEYWQASHLAGRGVYGTNRAGREKFGSFPAIGSDDGFFDLQFDDSERVVLPRSTVELPCPRSTGELLRRQSRIVDGYHEFVEWAGAHHPDRQLRLEGTDGRGWLDLGLWRRSAFARGLRRGSGVLDAVGYGVVETLARLNVFLRRTLGVEIPWR
jgi:glycosyltransferase involved in cell wall biosynthesis